METKVSQIFFPHIFQKHLIFMSEDMLKKIPLVS